MQKTHMRTVSGQPIWYLNPEKTEILLEDIYAGQMNLRYSGQNKVTILQHSAICSYLAELYNFNKEEIAYCASHDLHESYVGDIPKGLKECLPAYCEIESAWEERVHKELGFSWPPTYDIQEKIKHVDIRALCVEMWLAGWGNWEPANNLAIIYGGPPTGKELDIGLKVLFDPPNILWERILTCIKRHL